MDTITRGNAAEAAVIHALVGSGLQVLMPFGDGSPFDLAAVLPDDQIVRIQVKTGWVRNGCVEFKTASTDHGHGARHYRGRADLIVVYAPERDQIFVLSVNQCPTLRGFLRLKPPANSQRSGVRMASDFVFERWRLSLAEPLEPSCAADATG